MLMSQGLDLSDSLAIQWQLMVAFSDKFVFFVLFTCLALMIFLIDQYLCSSRPDIPVELFVRKVSEKIVLSADNPNIYKFINNSNDVESTLSYYFFNVTNPYEVLNKEKPKLEEFGPFVYK